MPLSSSSVLRSTSAETRRSVYLSIQRSWISRIGTGLRKCSFSRPDRRVTTRPASSSTRRCFITPKRVISNSDSSSPSVRPSRSKSRSRRCRRVGSASALKTSVVVHAYIIRDQTVTCQFAGRNYSANSISTIGLPSTHGSWSPSLSRTPKMPATTARRSSRSVTSLARAGRSARVLCLRWNRRVRGSPEGLRTSRGDRASRFRKIKDFDLVRTRSRTAAARRFDGRRS